MTPECQGKETLAPTSTSRQVCGTGSPAVPRQRSSARCLVVGCILKAISPGLWEEEAGGIALESNRFHQPSMAKQGTQAAARLQSILFLLHKTFRFQPWAMAKQNPSVPQRVRRCHHLPQPRAGSSPWQPGLGTAGNPLPVSGIGSGFSSPTCAMTSSRKL